jgi:hypothetical protein
MRSAYEVDLTAEPGAISAIDDHDGFDADDCSIYDPGPDDDYIYMIEESIACDCGCKTFVRGKCMGCGADDPHRSKLGCGTI